MQPVSVDAAGQPECAYCFEATGTVRPRRMPPGSGEEDGLYLCAACWADVARAARAGAWGREA